MLTTVRQDGLPHHEPDDVAPSFPEGSIKLNTRRKSAILPLSNQQGGICMKGSIQYLKQRDRYYVQWYHAIEKKVYKIYKYNGEFLYHKKLAEKLLACMQADFEKGIFRIEKYTREIPTDVIPFMWQWLEDEKDHLTPATIKDYENSIRNHLEPWFTENPYQLHDLQYDVLCKLMSGINRAGKGKLNVMYCLRRCLEYAKKSNKIHVLPTFPEKFKYNVVDPIIKWIPETRQIEIIKAIPEAHQPIFWWLKYHMRRPSEAMALYKVDYLKNMDAFLIRRSFSSKKLIEQTKTKRQHLIPCNPDFKPIMKSMPVYLASPFFFVNPTGRLEGKHYQHDFLVDLWNTACKKVGEPINMYAGLKHSSCSQYINEKGLSLDELQMLTDHANRGSLLKYAAVHLETKRRLMRGKVLDFRR